MAYRKIKKDDWINQRRSLGIGGSEAAAALGLSPWKSAVQLYYEKTGQFDDKVDSEAVYWGSTLEDIIAAEFSSRTGLKIRRNNYILQSVECPWMIADIDREGVDDHGNKFVLEVKNTSEWMKSEWDEESKNAPIQYTLQLLHYLIVTGYDYGYFAILIGGNKFRYFRIDRDMAIEQHIIDGEKAFWDRVQHGDPPDVDGSSACSDFLSEFYGNSQDSIVPMTSDVDEIIEEMERLKAEVKETEKRITEIANTVKNNLGTSETGETMRYLVTWKNVITNRVDTGKLKAQHPDVYESVLNESIYRRFGVKKIKKGE